MAIDEGKTIPALPRATGASANDLFVVERFANGTTSNTVGLSVGSFLSNTQANVVVQNGHSLSTPELVVRGGPTPANSGVGNVTPGRVWGDGDYLYYACANGEIRRAALSSF